MNEETVEQVAENLYPDNMIRLSNTTLYNANLIRRKDFIGGAKWQQERMYSEEEVLVLLQKYRFDLSRGVTPVIGNTTEAWFEKFKK